MSGVKLFFIADTSRPTPPTSPLKTATISTQQTASAVAFRID